MFLASGPMAAGLVALVIGVFIGLLNPNGKYELAAAVIGGSLMRAVPSSLRTATSGHNAKEEPVDAVQRYFRNG